MMLLCCGTATAADTPTTPSPQLQKCLQRADDLPDIAAAEATAWIKNGGGNEAHYCHAVAQSNRGMHADSAREFWFLGAFYDKRGDARAILMHGLSAQEFMRAKDPKNAEGQYTAALKMAPNDAPSLLGRAEVRMAMEKYWDAIDDLNRALKIKPADADILRQRGRAWLQLGNDKNAQEDFATAADIEAAPPK